MKLTNVKIYSEDKIIDSGTIEITDRIISAITSNAETDAIDLKGCIVIPGFVDTHMHGSLGVDANNITKEDIDKLLNLLPKFGTTTISLSPTTIPIERMKHSLKTIADYIDNDNKPGQTDLFGIHTEGIFISKKFKGAHNEQYILKPDLELMKEFYEISNHHINKVAYAFEEADEDFTKFLISNKIIASIGHSAATFEDCEKAVKMGVNNLTHFHNALSFHHHREPGAITAGFYFDELYTEMIVDGIHVHPKVVDLVYKIKGSDRFIGITDATRFALYPDGKHSVADKTVIIKDKRVCLENGTLSGSSVGMIDVFKNILKFTNCSIEEAIKMTSTTACIQHKVIDKIGTISVNKDADLVVLDKDFNVVMTICKGKIAYSTIN